MDPPRRPAPPRAPHPDTTGETAASPRTTAGRESPSLFPPAPGEPQPGALIGPFRIVGELGRGGMAVVYEADDTELPRRVALKVLLPAGADAQAKARFIREAHAQAKITHDHVVTIYRVGEANGVSYIAMPVLKGQTLARALSITPRPPMAHVLRIGIEIAEGLAAAHAKGLIHRDIKPSNIWLEGQKLRVKILDFGLARDPHAHQQLDITIRGHVVGTPAYMSPEQARGEPIDHRTDLWSLGVVLYQMTTGLKPFAGDNTLSVMTSIISTEPDPPLGLVPDMPPALSALIQRLLSKEPDGRPATADEVVEELTAIAQAPTGRVVVWQPPQAADPWSDIDATDADAPAPAPGADRDREEPRRRTRRRDNDDSEDKPRSYKGLLIGVGAALGTVLLGGLVWLAVSAVSPKTKPTEPVVQKPDDPKPPPVPPKKKDPPAPDSERAAAEKLLPLAKLTVFVDGGSTHEVLAGGKLPEGRLTVTMIDFGESKDINRLYVANTFLPAVTDLRALTDVRMKHWQLELSAADIRLMSGMPLAKSLRRLDAPVELTHESLVHMKKFEQLNDVTFTVPQPDDALFGRLAELPQFQLLTLYELPAATNLTDKGWAAVAKLSLSTFTLVDSKTAPDALRVLSTRSTPARPPWLEFIACKDITDADLLALSQRQTDVKFLSFSGCDLTDEGLKHLAAVTSLDRLILRSTKVTEEGVKALSAARPKMAIKWEGKEFGPKAKP